MTKLAVIGAGMMGGAIVTGIVEKNILDPKEIFISDPDKGKVQDLCSRLGINATNSNAEAVRDAGARKKAQERVSKDCRDRFKRGCRGGGKLEAGGF